MLDFDDRPGASRETEGDQLRGDILASLADWKFSYGLEGQELAWSVMSALFAHLLRHEALEVRADFTARLADQSAQTVEKISEILRRDAAENGRLH